MLVHAEFDLPRLGDLHHPSPNVCQAAVEGDLEQGLLCKPRKICTEIDTMGVMFTQEVRQAGPCTGDPPPQRERGSARNPGMRVSSQNLQIATHPHGDPALLLDLILTTDHMIVTKVLRRALAPRGARLLLLQWNRVRQCCVRHNVWAMLVVLHQTCETLQKYK